MAETLSQLPRPALLAAYFFTALFPLILVHELGHFALAKLNKVHVPEFGIGFPPRLARLFTAGGTEYTLNMLPLGGFVRLAGENDPTEPGAFAAKSKSARAAVMFAGPAANFLLAALILSGLAMSGWVPEVEPAIDGVTIGAVNTGQPASDAGLQVLDIVIAVDGRPLSALPVAEASAGPAERATLALQQATDAATDRPMELTVLRGARRLEVDGPLPATGLAPSDLPGVSGLVATAPTAGGLEAGDIVTTAGDGPEALAGAGPFIVLRGIEVLELTVTPRLNADAGVGQMGVSISEAVVITQMGAGAAFIRGFEMTGSLLVRMVTELGRMISGRRDVAIAGPVGISSMTEQAAAQGVETFLSFMALLSLNLGVINLLPIPALDGGRLLFIAAELVRGRPVEPAREAVVHLIGFVLVIGLMLVVTAVEVLNLSGGGP